MKKNEGISLFLLGFLVISSLFIFDFTAMKKNFVSLFFAKKVIKPPSNRVMSYESRILQDRVNLAVGFLEMEDRIAKLMQKFDVTDASLSSTKDKEKFLQRRAKELIERMEEEVYSIDANIVHRDPLTYSSIVWVNVGEEENHKLQKAVIAKNSPVVVGNALLGVVESVEKNRAEVRLITDSKCKVAVRAVRGNLFDQVLLEKLDRFYQFCKNCEGAHEYIPLQELKEARQKLVQEKKASYLAKGEISGSALPLWRTRMPLLQGIGFNYDFSDEEHERFDLHDPSGILQIGDLLLTSGLDGIFPAGLEVGVVTKIRPLQEGAIYYEIEAESLIDQFHTLQNVTILPPL